MKKIVLIASLFLFSLVSTAQISSIEVSVYSWSEEDITGYFVLTQGKDTVKVQNIEDEYFYIDSLKAGDYEYRIVSSLTRQNEVYTRGTLSLEENQTAYLDIQLTSVTVSHYDYEPYQPGDEFSFKEELSFSLFGGINTDQLNPVELELGAYFRQGVHMALSHHTAWLFNVGYNYSQSYFNSDSSLISLADRTREYYSYLNLSVSTGIRFLTHDIKTPFLEGGFFELGTTYYLPVLFRHITVYDDTKIVQRKIHNYSDLRVHASIGWFPISLFAEYRLFDITKYDYPELPSYRAGIRLHISY